MTYENLGRSDTESSKCREFHYAQSGQPVNDSQNVSSYHRGSTTKNIASSAYHYKWQNV